MKWDLRDQKDERVVEYTYWDIIEWRGPFKRWAGVYIFADKTHNVKYIGKAGSQIGWVKKL